MVKFVLEITCRQAEGSPDNKIKPFQDVVRRGEESQSTVYTCLTLLCSNIQFSLQSRSPQHSYRAKPQNTEIFRDI